MTIPEIDIKEALLKISKNDFIKAERGNDTGIGFTLESKLGIKENNSGEPDFTYNGIPVELKGQRSNASSNITLITKSPVWKPLSATQIIRKYGYADVNDRKGLKVTLKVGSFNQQGLSLRVNTKNDTLDIVHRKDGIICYFLIDDLMSKVRAKLFENLLLVFADTRHENGIEFFHYTKAILLTGLNEKKFKMLLNEGKLVFEFRMHIKVSGGVRDHGSGFRLNKRYIRELYEKNESIL